MKTLREVLGVSDSAPKLGVLGETGDLPDRWREILRQIMLAHQMWLAPPGSLPKEIATAALNAGGWGGVEPVCQSKRMAVQLQRKAISGFGFQKKKHDQKSGGPSRPSGVDTGSTIERQAT